MFNGVFLNPTQGCTTCNEFGSVYLEDGYEYTLDGSILKQLGILRGFLWDRGYSLFQGRTMTEKNFWSHGIIDMC